mmetsp:Transcript_10814/g.18503  ORF Transcript_10814/g.18503 Transcript_10814/m.18503 type:complete len:127 (-) Transcript_10814:99-479(-)|eukprot:CAMPEP_0184707284 /NCGR_PEP_ID=MMETSP0313-20130426/37192_1 /TAXON_ID=2792 /ORGANISM="Porphyridium aerugineum, Strain SAG 1380-2" /LENGTH=126 /DNA_ID=CAMNT_0027168859 /DNA_START=708 /DNA_END=1088 /DNA_ORIENTATION=-
MTPSIVVLPARLYLAFVDANTAVEQRRDSDSSSDTSGSSRASSSSPYASNQDAVQKTRKRMVVRRTSRPQSYDGYGYGGNSGEGQQMERWTRERMAVKRVRDHCAAFLSVCVALMTFQGLVPKVLN